MIGADGQVIIDRWTDLPASERFFAGGDTTVRGFALDRLGIRRHDKDGSRSAAARVVIFNAELRVPVAGNVGRSSGLSTAATSSSTSAISTSASFAAAVGFGGRYRSPVGPIRVDLGFKVHREPGEGAVAFHVSLGQAF